MSPPSEPGMNMTGASVTAVMTTAVAKVLAASFLVAHTPSPGVRASVVSEQEMEV